MRSMEAGPPSPASQAHEHAIELRKESYTMALYVASVCSPPSSRCCRPGTLTMIVAGKSLRH